MRKGKVALLNASDIHLSHRPPVSRSSEPDWYEAMRRPLGQLAALKARYDCPLVYPGDIFHKADSPPELINFAIRYLPPGFSVPGQHDLPYHRLSDVRKSAYWTLVEAKVLTPLDPGVPTHLPGLVLHGFPWGVPVAPRPKNVAGDGKAVLHVAVAHAYTWKHGHSHPGRLKEQLVTERRAALRGYDAAFFGDNHKGFLDPGTPPVVNCGSFIRRNADEKEYRPAVGVLTTTGEVYRQYLDTRLDQWCEAGEVVEGLIGKGWELAEFIEDLDSLGDVAMDFLEAVKRALDSGRVGDEVRRRVLEACEHE